MDEFHDGFEGFGEGVGDAPADWEAPSEPAAEQRFGLQSGQWPDCGPEQRPDCGPEQRPGMPAQPEMPPQPETPHQPGRGPKPCPGPAPEPRPEMPPQPGGAPEPGPRPAHEGAPRLAPEPMLYLDCQSGIAGDMLVAALLDLGASEAALRAALASLPLEGYRVEISRVKKAGIDCCDFNVVLDAGHDGHDHDMAWLHGVAGAQEAGSEGDVPDAGAVAPGPDGLVAGDDGPGCGGDGHQHGHDHAHDHAHGGRHHHHGHEHRGLPEVEAIINAAALTPGARELALRAFRILAEAEARAHALPVEQVHFHEVGAVDSIVDIVAAAVLLDDLGIRRVVVPVLVEGYGSVRCQHGVIPVPAPATLNICIAYGLPLAQGQVEGELVTPTGAALVAALDPLQELPARYRVRACGMGAGKRAYARPSVLRAMVIEELAPPSPRPGEGPRPRPDGGRGPRGPRPPYGPQPDWGPQGPYPEGGWAPHGPQEPYGPDGSRGPHGPQPDVGPHGPQPGWGMQGPRPPHGPQPGWGPCGPRPQPEGDWGPESPRPNGDFDPCGPRPPRGPQPGWGPRPPHEPCTPHGPHDGGARGVPGPSYGSQGPQPPRGNYACPPHGGRVCPPPADGRSPQEAPDEPPFGPGPWQPGAPGRLQIAGPQPGVPGGWCPPRPEEQFGAWGPDRDGGPGRPSGDGGPRSAQGPAASFCPPPQWFARPAEPEPSAAADGPAARGCPPPESELPEPPAQQPPAAAPDQRECFIVKLECDIDDSTGEQLAYAAERLRGAGAREVHWLPVFAKKGRPAWQLQVLCMPEDAPRLEGIIFAETSTIGVRRQALERTVLPRSIRVVSTPCGPVRCKAVALPGGGERVAPEYEDCAAIAREQGVPLRAVMDAALWAAGQ